MAIPFYTDYSQNWWNFPGYMPQWGPGNNSGCSSCHHQRHRDEDSYADDEVPPKPSTPANYIDLDANGKFKAGRDAEITFDFDGNGKIDKEDIEKSKRALKAYDKVWSGDASQEDLDLLKQFDKNHDGKLDAEELKKATFIGVDRNGDGKIGAGEIFSSDQIETSRGTFQLESFDLRTGSFKSQASL